jgi:hypothetical protein
LDPFRIQIRRISPLVVNHDFLKPTTLPATVYTDVRAVWEERYLFYRFTMPSNNMGRFTAAVQISCATGTVDIFRNYYDCRFACPGPDYREYTTAISTFTNGAASWTETVTPCELNSGVYHLTLKARSGSLAQFFNTPLGPDGTDTTIGGSLVVGNPMIKIQVSGTYTEIMPVSIPTECNNALCCRTRNHYLYFDLEAENPGTIATVFFTCNDAVSCTFRVVDPRFTKYNTLYERDGTATYEGYHRSVFNSPVSTDSCTSLPTAVVTVLAGQTGNVTFGACAFLSGRYYVEATHASTVAAGTECVNSNIRVTYYNKWVPFYTLDADPSTVYNSSFTTQGAIYDGSEYQYYKVKSNTGQLTITLSGANAVGYVYSGNIGQYARDFSQTTTAVVQNDASYSANCGSTNTAIPTTTGVLTLMTGCLPLTDYVFIGVRRNVTTCAAKYVLSASALPAGTRVSNLAINTLQCDTIAQGPITLATNQPSTNDHVVDFIPLDGTSFDRLRWGPAVIYRVTVPTGFTSLSHYFYAIGREFKPIAAAGHLVNFEAFSNGLCTKLVDVGSPFDTNPWAASAAYTVDYPGTRANEAAAQNAHIWNYLGNLATDTKTVWVRVSNPTANAINVYSMYSLRVSFLARNITASTCACATSGTLDAVHNGAIATTNVLGAVQALPVITLAPNTNVSRSFTVTSDNIGFNYNPASPRASAFSAVTYNLQYYGIDVIPTGSTLGITYNCGSFFQSTATMTATGCGLVAQSPAIPYSTTCNSGNVVTVSACFNHASTCQSSASFRVGLIINNNVAAYPTLTLAATAAAPWSLVDRAGAVKSQMWKVTYGKFIHVAIGKVNQTSFGSSFFHDGTDATFNADMVNHNAELILGHNGCTVASCATGATLSGHTGNTGNNGIFPKSGNTVQYSCYVYDRLSTAPTTTQTYYVMVRPTAASPTTNTFSYLLRAQNDYESLSGGSQGNTIQGKDRRYYEIAAQTSGADHSVRIKVTVASGPALWVYTASKDYYIEYIDNCRNNIATCDLSSTLSTALTGLNTNDLPRFAQ